MAAPVSASVVSSDMQLVRSWSDVAPFAGRVIAFKTNSDSHQFKGNQGYFLKDNSTRFGFIDTIWSCWKDEGIGYNMSMLLKPGDVSQNRLLVRSELVDFSMRLATENELRLIDRAITAGQARIEYTNNDRIKAILEREFDSHKKIIKGKTKTNSENE